MLSLSPAQNLISQRFAAAAIAFAAALCVLAIAPATSRADACTPPVSSPVACENTKPGADRSTWWVDGSGDESIQGFATAMSVQPGDAISFKIKSATANYHIDILRLGYYGGDGARLIDSGLTPTNTSAQPACDTFSSTGLIDCGNWSVSKTWTVPSTAVSGVYIAHLVRDDTGGESHITFVVRDDSSHSDVVVQTSDTTWQAYNTYGGNSLYRCTVACPPGEPQGYKAAYKVSYNRPVITEGVSQLFSGAEYPMIRFLEANGYDVSYISGVDVHRRGSLLLNHKLFISSGHDEYWSGTQRASMEAARDAGVNEAFFSGNTGYWRTRWEPSADGSNTQDRTMVAYKDTHFDARMDPTEWTGTWRDPRFTTEAEGVKPENSLTGQSFIVNSGTSRITVPYAYRQLRLWRNTAVASLTSGQSLQLAPETLGVEWDADADNGFRPAGSFQVSSTTATGLELFVDYGSNTVFGGTATHNMTLYRASSGALVFGAGTMQWSFGLDSENRAGNAPDRNMQQATVNLFADMGAQPRTLISGLAAASESTDATAPTATFSSPPTSVADGSAITLSGTASDTGGGVVAGVEVSVDNGATWHRATGTASWTYSWIAHGTPAATIKVRATDDSGNIGHPGAGTAVTVNCPCSIWGVNVTPATADAGDPSSAEIGVKFRSDTYGTVTGIRFYKATGNTGTHTGSLWTASGQRLAQATFTSETASGWQMVTFAEPVEVQPNTTYVASYFAPNGHYAATPNYFWRAPAPGPNGGAVADGPPLRAVRNSGTTTNGVYSYGASSTFPVSSYGAANYWVDVLFTRTPAPGQVTGVTATEGSRTSANVSWSTPSSGGAPTSYTVTPYIGATAQTSKTVAASALSTTVSGLTSGTTYTFTVQASNPNGSGAISAASNAVTPSVPVAPSSPSDLIARPAGQSALLTWTPPASDGDSAITSQTITPYIGATAQSPVTASASATSATITGLTNGTSYTFKVTATNGVGTSPASVASTAIVPQATLFDFSAPGDPSVAGSAALELGLKFKPDYDGTITGVRFYKGTGNTGTHSGSLWTAGGTRLAQATFTKETASGWQSVTFSSPVAVTAGTTYVASYFSPGGTYTVTGGALNSVVDNGPLHTISNGVSANGVYAYGATSTFPSLTYNGANYWVDVLYALPVPGQVTGVAAIEGGRTSAHLNWSPPTSGGPVSAYRITPYVGTVAQASRTVPAPATSASVPGLTNGTTYTFAISALNANGAGMASAKSNAVTPLSPVVPMAPTNVIARPATKSVRVSWTPSASDGDSAITSQTITPYIGSGAQPSTEVGLSATSATLTGLSNGVAYTFKVSATNSIGTSTSSAPSSSATPQSTILDFAEPSTQDGGDVMPVEVGVKFRPDFNGKVAGIRFYKSTANTGTHVGNLWTLSGTKLASATFTNESATGWQSVTFPEPIEISPNITYIASYFAPNGHYSVTPNGFSSGIDNPPLHALSSLDDANGVYAYGPSSTFPASNYGASNYFVDVLFAPAAAPGPPTAVTATPGQGSAAVTWTAPSTGGPVSSYTVMAYAGLAVQVTKTITGSPPVTSATITGLTAGVAYTLRVVASNPTGDGAASAASNSISPLDPVAPGVPTAVNGQADDGAAIVTWAEPSSDGGTAITGYTITPFLGSNAQTPIQVAGSATSVRIAGLVNGSGYTFTVAASNSAGPGPASAPTAVVTPRASIFGGLTPIVADGGDTNSVVVGVKFRSDVDGTVTGLRFYKSPGNTGTHVGTLWSADGDLIAQGTFTAETASGWQALTFTSPVAIMAGTTYVASYLAPNGHYSVTASAFHPNGFDNPPLHAIPNPVSPNGTYVYADSPTFPTGSFNAANYWVDVLFAPGS
jgi:hypothetical protein